MKTTTTQDSDHTRRKRSKLHQYLLSNRFKAEGVFKTLSVLADTLCNREKLIKRYGFQLQPTQTIQDGSQSTHDVQSIISDAKIEDVEPVLHEVRNRLSVLNKLKWALKDKEKFKKLITDLRSHSESLYRLCPENAFESMNIYLTTECLAGQELPDNLKWTSTLATEHAKIDRVFSTAGLQIAGFDGHVASIRKGLALFQDQVVYVEMRDYRGQPLDFTTEQKQRLKNRLKWERFLSSFPSYSKPDLSHIDQYSSSDEDEPIERVRPADPKLRALIRNFFDTFQGANMMKNVMVWISSSLLGTKQKTGIRSMLGARFELARKLVRAVCLLHPSGWLHKNIRADSKQYKDELNNPHRENDFMFQRLLEASTESGRSGEPGQFWLEHLLCLLETDHEDLLDDAAKTDNVGSEDTYKHFVENYALQIWRAADGYEFFLNERLVDFEGDTQSVLETEVKGTRMQLIWMTTEDMIHLILPISPEVAVVFCDESRCWESPFADIMHRFKKPYPQNSLLEERQEVLARNGSVASKYWYPDSTASPHHRIIASYSLSHARSVIIVQSRARFERARRELEIFNRERMDWWQSIGIRSGYPDDRRQRTHPTKDQMDRVVDEHMTALDEVLKFTKNTNDKLPRTKENALKSWLAIRACQAIRISSSTSDGRSSSLRIMHPALKAAFEAAYPPKHPDHRDLVTIDFDEFLDHAMGNETFAQLSVEIDKKITELVHSNNFESHFETFRESARSLANTLLKERNGDSNEQSINQEDTLKSPSFRSFFRAAQDFDVLKWMFEERQDILATFIKEIAAPMEAMQPRAVRIRARRE
ncbi:hypothetical protein FACUT_13655 [Fusarium acutatum]|uniref:Prion-inhibition and propagation HeLo domain-containing protein n=1 Tax=Fusarium acutatum TaxID=78861 RepID=A0A8H4JB31_9HYPO|nr:hypothetical protein FACUT_13655 [Fusarium acutatum]